MGIIEEEDSSIDFNSSLRSKPLSDGGDKLQSNIDANNGNHHVPSSGEPVNIIQTVQIPREKAFESHRADEMHVELAGMPLVSEDMLLNQEHWQPLKAKTFNQHEL